MESKQENKLREFFKEQDRFAKANGIVIEDMGEGVSMTSMVVEDRHLNGADVCHGGAIFTLADFAFALASNSYGTLALGINASISYLKGAKKGEKLTAIAREIDKNFKLGSYTINVTNEENEIVAIFQGMVYRKDKNII